MMISGSAAASNKIFTMRQRREHAADGFAMYQRGGERNCRLRALVLMSARIGRLVVSTHARFAEFDPILV